MKKNFFQIQGAAEGTSYNIVFEAVNGDGVQDEVDALILDFESSLSVYDPNSIISRVNRNEDIELDDYFRTVFSRAKEISEQTGGLFDISAESLFREWGFSFKENSPMNPDKVLELLQSTGMDKIWLDGDNLIKMHPEIKLNANAIAKGYSTDLVAKLLDSKDIENYLIEVGGEIRTKGISPRGVAWTIGVDRPLDTNLIPGQDVQVILSLTNKALATSGNYRQFYIQDGKKISHTINPKTGYPVNHTLLSVTVIADDAMSADAYATAFLVAGIDGSLDLLDKIEDIEVLFICDEDGEFKVHYTEGLEQYILQ